MINYFQVKVRVTRTIKGKPKRVFENYLVWAQSFTEAEANIMQSLLNPERENFEQNKTMTINAIDRFQIDDIFGSDFSEKYWLVKVDYNVLDGKPVRLKYLINSASPEKASSELLEIIAKNESSSRFEVTSISASSILEVFTYETSNSTTNESAEESEEVEESEEMNVNED